MEPAGLQRHPATDSLLGYFTKLPTKTPVSVLDEIRRHCEAHARIMASMLPDGPELTTGLRKLLEAKDCFVRAAIVDAD